MGLATERTRRTILAVQALLALAIGTVACVWLIRTKPMPSQRSAFARVLEVAAVPVMPAQVAEPIAGYGTVRAKNQVQIIPQVSGQLVSTHQNLATGKVIPKGDLLFEIDSTVHSARVRQAEAEVRRLEASLERADQETANLDDRIANIEEMLAIDEQDYLTSKRLYDEEQVGTSRDVDLVYQKYLRQKDALVELRSRRSIIPHIKLETEAELDAARARLKQAEHDLDNTRIFCPFDARVEVVSAYKSQVVTAHFAIATLTDLSAFELSVGIDPRELRWLEEAIRPQALEQESSDERPVVTVRWSLHGQEFTWRGHVTRFERVDEATRTVRLVVEVRNVDMVANVDLGNDDAKPSLAIGMHCRAELPALPLKDALLVPRHAIYNNRWVYVFEPDGVDAAAHTGRLGRREVPMLRSAADSVLVDYAGRQGTELCELRPGELIVVSPLVKPVVGMEIRLRDERVAVLEPVPSSSDKPTNTAPPQLGFRVHPAVLGQVSPLRGGG